MVEFEIEKVWDEGQNFSVDLKYLIKGKEKKTRMQFSKESYQNGEWKKGLARFLKNEEINSEIKVDLTQLKGKKIKLEDFETDTNPTPEMAIEENPKEPNPDAKEI